MGEYGDAGQVYGNTLVQTGHFQGQYRPPAEQQPVQPPTNSKDSPFDTLKNIKSGIDFAKNIDKWLQNIQIVEQPVDPYGNVKNFAVQEDDDLEIIDLKPDFELIEEVHLFNPIPKPENIDNYTTPIEQTTTSPTHNNQINNTDTTNLIKNRRKGYMPKRSTLKTQLCTALKKREKNCRAELKRCRAELKSLRGRRRKKNTATNAKKKKRTRK